MKIYQLMRNYIEKQVEVEEAQEWGKGRNVAKVIKDGDMPPIYEKILQLEKKDKDNPIKSIEWEILPDAEAPEYVSIQSEGYVFTGWAEHLDLNFEIIHSSKTEKIEDKAIKENIEAIIDELDVFFANFKRVKVKSAQRKARVSSLKLEKLLKKFRKESNRVSKYEKDKFH